MAWHRYLEMPPTAIGTGMTFFSDQSHSASHGVPTMTDSKRQTHNGIDQSVKTPIVAAEQRRPIGQNNIKRPHIVQDMNLQTWELPEGHFVLLVLNHSATSCTWYRLPPMGEDKRWGLLYSELRNS